MTFLELAFSHVARGLHVLPLKPRDKSPIVAGGCHAASADETQIPAWWAKTPQANVGIGCGASNKAVLDIDHGLSSLEDFQLWRIRNGLPETYTVRTGRRPEFGIQMYFEGAMPDVGAWELDGCSGQVKSLGGLVCAAGCVHPLSGETYQVICDVPFAPTPDKVRQLKTAPKSSVERSPREKITEGRNNSLVSRVGTFRRDNPGVSEDSTLAFMQQWNIEECADPMSCDEVEECVRKQFRLYPDAERLPKVVIGDAKVAPPEQAVAARNRPAYPIAIWDGTPAGEFARICTHDNNIPRKFFVEAWNCILGAVVGDRLTSTSLGGIPRSYTFLITKAGCGKGTVIRRATGFWKAGWSSSFTSAAPGFLRGEQDFSWKPTGIGARNASASSGPGMTRLILDNKKTPVQLSWHGTIPRIISVHEETKTFLSALFIEGGTGTNLDGVVCSLWDDVEFAAPGTGTRQAIYGEMQFSMLCAITEGDWFDLLSKGDVVGGGLMSRLNIIGSLGEYDRVSDIKKDLDFTELQKQILPRIERLADAPCILAPTEGARRVMAEWHLSLPEDAVRANVRAWRSALVLSFLRQEDNISERTAIDATLLGDYQIASHEFYTVLKADNPLATVQYKILRALEMKGPVKKGRLQDFTNAQRVGTDLWGRALEGLIRDGKVGKREDGTYYRAVAQ